MRKKLKGTYTPDTLRIYYTPFEAVKNQSAKIKRTWQYTQNYVNEGERKIEEAEKAARAAKMPKTAREIAKWLNSGRRVFARNQEAERIKTETLARKAAEQERKAQQAAAIRNEGKSSQSKDEKRGGFGKAVWGAIVFFLPFDFYCRGTKHNYGMFVRLLTESLVAIGLLPPDHPARRLQEAIKTSIASVVREASLNLPPLGDVWTAYRTRSAPDCLAYTRQYAAFCGVVGAFALTVLITARIAWSVLFGSVKAFAQVAGADPMKLGNFTFTGDIASNILDGIFGTGTGANSIVTSGLGSMLAFYSNTILVFAGIILIWIIISAVAETARTGIPFGKQFNHVWAPIRLVVALGLLVPLGAGLNSGQLMTISLAKWGSEQATHVWTIFVNNFIAAGGTSGLTQVPFNVSANRTFTDNALQSLVCQQINNDYIISNGGTCNGNPLTDDPGCVQQYAVGTVTMATPVASVTTDGVTAAQAPQTVPARILWASNLAYGGQVNCGGAVVQVPNSSASGTSGSTAAMAATQALLQNQNNAAASFVNNATPLADGIAQAALQGDNGVINYPTADGYAAYQTMFNSYVQGKTTAMTQTIKSYNTSVLSGMAVDAKTYGWAYAPVWLFNIAAQNGQVMDNAQVAPNVLTVDQMNPGASNPFPGNPTTGGAWSNAMKILNTWEPSNQSANNPLAQTNFGMMATMMQQLTSEVGNNPLGQAGSYGDMLATEGFTIITPPEEMTCLADPSSTGCELFQQKLQQQTGVITALGGEQGAQFSNYVNHGLTAVNGQPSILPDTKAAANKFAVLNALVTGQNSPMRSILFPIGMIMISVGFMLKMLTLIVLVRFTLGILNWLIMVFEAVLAMPFVSLGLLTVEGEGFLPPTLKSTMPMMAAVIVRPILMTISLVIGLICFNTIMQVVNILMAPTIQSLVNTGTPSANSYLSLGMYMIFYATLAYTLANSAFKVIDVLPNFVMGWIGQRMESRVDDASMVQQQAQGYMQTMAYSSRGGAEWREHQKADMQTLAKHGYTGPNAAAQFKADLSLNDQANPKYQNAVQTQAELDSSGMPDTTAANIGGGNGPAASAPAAQSSTAQQPLKSAQGASKNNTDSSRGKFTLKN